MNESKNLATFYCIVNKENKLAGCFDTNLPLIGYDIPEDIAMLQELLAAMLLNEPEMHKGCKIIKLQEVSE